MHVIENRFSLRIPAAATTALALALLAPSPVRAQGPEQTAKFVKTVEGTMKSIGDARLQVEKTLTGYNSIIDLTAKDNKDAYKDLGKNITESEKKVAETTVKVDEMNAEAERHFAAWKDSQAAITDPALRKKSEDRMADAQTRYKAVSAAGKDTRQTFDTLMTDLKNQATFLGSDLNTAAITSIKPEAAKFNTRAKGLFGKVDGANKMLGDYAASMKP